MENHFFGYGENVFLMFNAFSQQVDVDMHDHKILSDSNCFFCFQGSAIEPIYASTRLIFLSMMIASVVVFESYCASYAAFLNVVQLSSPFDSVADLYANTGFKVGGIKGTSYKSTFVVSRYLK